VQEKASSSTFSCYPDCGSSREAPIFPLRLEAVPIHQAGEEEVRELQKAEEALQGLREEVEGRSNLRKDSRPKVWEVFVRSVVLASSLQGKREKERRKERMMGLEVLGDVLEGLALMI